MSNNNNHDHSLQNRSKPSLNNLTLPEFLDPMDDTLQLHFNDISRIIDKEDGAMFDSQNPGDISSITDVGFLN